jgi:hypothetical protein
MSRPTFAFLVISALGCFALFSLPAAQADDYSYARVVRLSLVQGQVQVAHPDIEGWEQAVVNMPIEQGYTIATGQGLAEIEFESGMTARLSENTTLQFTELALSDGARLTKLNLTQGTATFYANLASHDAFSVTTPGVEVSVPESARFRLDVYADGSTVDILKGSVDVNSSAGTHRVSKGSTLSYRTNDPDEVTIARSGAPDAWDKWVSNREDVIEAGNAAGSQYVNAPFNYGLSDLYTYGSWYPIDGYGYGWRPYGATLSWVPFMTGAWNNCPGYGLSWVSNEPWGWLPYHYGGWIFSPVNGWMWVPGGFRLWQPAVVTFVRVGNQVGFVPLHPHDQPGQTPGNLQQGVLVPGAAGFAGAKQGAPNNGFIGARTFEHIVVPEGGKNVQVLAAAPREVGPGRHAPLEFAPGMNQGKPMPSGAGSVASGSSGSPEAPRIVFDQREHRWVNNPSAPAGANVASAPPAPALRQSVPPPMPSSSLPLRQNGSGWGQRPSDSPDRFARPGAPAQYPPASQMMPRAPNGSAPTPPPAPSRTFAPPPPAPRSPSYAPSQSFSPRPMSPSPSGPAPAPHYSPPPSPPPAPAAHTSAPPPSPPAAPPKAH